MKHKLQKILLCALSMVLALALMTGSAFAEDDTDSSSDATTESASSDSSDDTSSSTCAINAELSCYISAMGGVEFGDVFQNATVTVNDDNSYTLTLYFGTQDIYIYSLALEAFVDVSESEPGYYDANGNLVTDGVTWTMSGEDDTVLDDNGEYIQYCTSISYTVEELSCINYLYIYINSGYMGVQFCDGSGSGASNQPGVLTPYKATLTLGAGSSGLDESLFHDFTTSDGGDTYRCGYCGHTYTKTDVTYTGTGDYESSWSALGVMVYNYFGYDVYVSDELDDGSYNIMIYYGGTSGYSAAIGDFTLYDADYTTESGTVSAVSFGDLSSDPVYIFNVDDPTETLYASLYVGGAMDMSVTFSITAAAVEEAETDYIEQWAIGKGKAYSVLASLYEETDDDGNTTYSLVISGSGTTSSFGSTSDVPWYSSYRTGITSLTVEEGVTVESMSFWLAGCTSFDAENLQIPDTVTSVKGLFYGWTQLSALPDDFTLPDGVTDTSYMFYGCTALTALPDDFTLPDGVTDVSYMFRGCTAITSLPDTFILPDTTTDCSYLFYGCTALASIPDDFTIPDSVTTTTYMFYNCKKLAALPDGFTLGSCVEDAGYMFGNCSVLTALPDDFTIPEGITALDHMFYGCTTLASIPDDFTIPEGTEDVSYLFYNCKKLESIPETLTIPDSVTTTADMFYYCSTLTEIPETLTVGKNVTSMAYMFCYCSGITEIPDTFVIPDTVTNVSYMFRGCTKLTSLSDGIVIPEGCTTVQYMFYGCSKLTELPDGFTLADGTTTISYMFYSCSSLTALPDGFTIPSSVTTMKYAFSGCSALTVLPSGFSMPSLSYTSSSNGGYRAFYVSSSTVTYCESDVYETLSEAYDWSKWNRTLTVCDHTDDELDEDSVSWNWADDYSTAALELTCACGSEVLLSIDGTITAEYSDEATCTTDQTVTYTATATYNGEEYTDSQTAVYVEALGHDYTVTWMWSADDYSTAIFKVVCANDDSHSLSATEVETTSETTEATCTEDGVIVYTATYTPDEGYTYTDSVTAAIPATGHTEAEAVTETTAATCEEDGSIDSVIYCETCGEELSRETVEVLEATGHDYVSEVTTEATCTEDGVLTYTCANDETHTYTEVIEATGHTEADAVTENEVEATCTEDGSYDTVIYCETCGEELSRKSYTVKATGHTEADAVTENEVEATCTEDGSYDTVIYCSTCGEELSRETVTTEALGHDYAAKWSWSKDYSSATVTVTCANDSSDKTTVEATITEEIITEATCTTEGEKTVTATATVDEVEYTSEKTVSIDPIAHTMTKYEAVAATCTEDGTIEYYVCEVCGGYFSDEDGTAEITADDMVEEATGHDYEYEVTTEATCTEDGVGTYTCSVCGDTYTEAIAASHSYQAGDADANGVVTYTCSVCGDSYAVYPFDTYYKHAVTLNYVTYFGSEATVTQNEDGKYEVTFVVNATSSLLSDVAMIFDDSYTYTSSTDDEGYITYVLTLSDLTQTIDFEFTYTVTIMNMTHTFPFQFVLAGGTWSGHDAELTYVEAVEATCGTDGSEAYYECETCGTLFSDEDGTEEVSEEDLIIEATGDHTEAEAVTENETAATCEENGSYDSVVYCSVCGEELSRTTYAEKATGHDYTYTWMWDEDDYSTATVKAVCANDSDQSVTTEVETTETILTAVTCTEDGEATYTATFSPADGCSDTSEKTVTLTATGHTEADAVTENEVAATCEEDGSYDTVVYCSTCGEELSRETTVTEATGHSYDDGVVTEEATCEEDGVITYTCANDETHTYTEAIEATGHDYSVTKWSWSDDYTAATATIVCANDATDKNIVEADVSTSTDETCTESVTVSTAVVTYDGETFTDTKTIEEALDGEHSYDNGVVTAATCDTAGYTTYTCTTCGDSYITEETEALGHSYDEGTVTTAATCTEDGVMTYTCSVCGDTYTEAIAASHTWNEGVITYGEDGCGSGGTITYTCTVCGETKTEAVTASEHTAAEAVTENYVEATCETNGSYDTVVYCSVCGAELSRETTTIAATGHDYIATVVEPTCVSVGFTNYVCQNDASHVYTGNFTSATGHSYEGNVCTGCGDLRESDLSEANTVKLSKTSYTYTGKAKKPGVTVIINGTTLTKGTDYTVSYSNNTKTGKATVKITGKGSYTGSVTKTFTIKPAKAKTPTLKSSTKKQLKVSWKKSSGSVTGYQIAYRVKGTSTWKYVTTTSTSKTIKSLKSGKTYQVKVRAYKTISGSKVYGSWSTTKTKKVK